MCGLTEDEAAVTEQPALGGSSKTIIIVLVIVALLVAVGVTLFAQKKKILCFKQPAGSSDEATGKSPLLSGDAGAASKGSPSRATSASGTTIDKSRPSGTTVSGH